MATHRWYKLACLLGLPVRHVSGKHNKREHKNYKLTPRCQRQRRAKYAEKNKKKDETHVTINKTTHDNLVQKIKRGKEKQESYTKFVVVNGTKQAGVRLCNGKVGKKKRNNKNALEYKKTSVHYRGHEQYILLEYHPAT